MIEYEFLPADPSPRDSDLEDIAALLPQLSVHADSLAQERLTAVTRGSRVLVARNLAAAEEGKGRIIGTACLVPIPIPTGLNGSIEDLVVDRGYRRRGIGEQLMRRLIAEAKRLGMRRLLLTSRPSRESANRLHRRIGFQLRKTNSYARTL